MTPRSKKGIAGLCMAPAALSLIVALCQAIFYEPGLALAGAFGLLFVLGLGLFCSALGQEEREQYDLKVKQPLPTPPRGCCSGEVEFRDGRFQLHGAVSHDQLTRRTESRSPLGSHSS